VQCIQQQKVIHVWKDEDNFCHLELIETTQGINPTVQAAAQPAPQPQPQPAQMASSFATQQVAQQQAPQAATSYPMPWD
jgi:hypothetical protein